MSMFECSRCKCGDNTALAENFWWDSHFKGNPPLCSECDPQQGKWHHEFPKVPAHGVATQELVSGGANETWYLWRNGGLIETTARLFIKKWLK